MRPAWKHVVVVAFLWQVVPMILGVVLVETMPALLVPCLVCVLGVVPVVAGTHYRCMRLGLAAFFLPLVIAGVLFGIFAFLVYVPAGQHP